MNIGTKLRLGTACMAALLSRKRRPVFVGWALTERCNLRCRYCHVWEKKPAAELDTGQVTGIIRDLHEQGVRVIKFSGGEPLLRKDLGDIVAFSRSLGIHTSISTNGTLFPSRIGELKHLAGLGTSLDGPEDVHDAIRGTGTYRATLAAMEAALQERIPVKLTTVLSSANLDCWDHVLEVAERFDAQVTFQPATETVLFGTAPNPLIPEVGRYRQAIRTLLERKRTNRLISNSAAGLRHLYHWPDPRSIHCVGGKLLLRLDCRGHIQPCSRLPLREGAPDAMTHGVRYCLDRLPVVDCQRCWCGSVVDLNLGAHFCLDAAISMVRHG